MDGHTGFEEIPSWFVVLPDSASVASVAAALCQRATQEVSHPSGRPWLLGCWDDDTTTARKRSLDTSRSYSMGSVSKW